MDNKKIRFVGECIYCGDINTADLLDEHIIPYGISGDFILKKASCKKCAVITSRFERNVLRNMLMPARARMRLPTYHPKNRPAKLPILLKKEGKKEELYIPTDEYGVKVFFPFYRLPGLMDSNKYKGDIEVKGFVLIRTGDLNDDELMNKYKVNEYGFRQTYKPGAFALMLAKIGYGFTVLKYGTKALKKNYVLPYILGKATTIGQHVGSTDIRKGIKGTEIRLEVRNNVLHAFIRLFSLWEVPTYVVVIGELSVGTK